MRAGVVLLALAGCNQLFGLDETQVIRPDAPIDAPGCAPQLFSSPMKLAGSFQPVGNNFDPAFATLLELWFVRRRGGGELDMFTASRTSEQDPFGDARLVMGLTLGDTSPALSADGLDLVFVRGSRVYETTRPSVSAAFGPPVLAAGVTATATFGIDLSFDGLTLYYADLTGELYSVTRESRGQPFGAPSVLLASNVKWPAVSPDQLELYYDSMDVQQIIHRMTRANVAVPFDSDQAMMVGTDPDVSPDSRSLLISNAGEIQISHRTCM
jgi:hypothetical protein